MIVEREDIGLQPLDIAQAQEIAFDVLCELDDFCRQAGIEYFLVGGALIGAVRSGDLIPWDDDIDVVMKRDSYNRFCAEYRDNDKFSLFTYRRTPNYRHGMAKLCDNDTVFVEQTACDGPFGVFVDVFPLDYVSSKEDPKISFVNKRIRVYNYAHVLSPLATKGSPLKTAIRVALGQTLGRANYTLALNRLEASMKSAETPFLMSHWGAWGAKECVPSEWFSETTPVKLRGRSFPAPVGFDKYLTQVYGDYMSPPTNPPHYHGMAYKKSALERGAMSSEQAYRTKNTIPISHVAGSSAVPAWSSVWADLVYLVMCALAEEPADEAAVAGMDLPAILRTARDHSVSALAAAPLLALWRSHPASEEVMAPWVRADEGAAYRYLVVSSERKAISDWMEEQGIWHMPLKGSLVCDLYPSPHLREFCDVDVLFDSAFRDKLVAHMQERGYTFEDDYEHNDTYLKPPLYNFEMHRSLVHRSADKLWASYYENVRERLVPATGRAFELRFTNEDFYVYMVYHAAHHMRKGGVGIRTLADFGVMLKAWGETMDWEKVDAGIECLGLGSQERIWRSLATKLFSGGDYRCALTEGECMMLADMLVSGTFGDVSASILQHVVNRQDQFGGLGRAKVAYVLRRLFPSFEELSRYREGLQKRPWLLPYYWAKRIVDAGKRGALTDELGRVARL